MRGSSGSEDVDQGPNPARRQPQSSEEQELPLAAGYAEEGRGKARRGATASEATSTETPIMSARKNGAQTAARWF
jgi:hypothetical protein